MSKEAQAQRRDPGCIYVSLLQMQRASVKLSSKRNVTKSFEQILQPVKLSYSEKVPKCYLWTNSAKEIMAKFYNIILRSQAAV